MTVHGLATTVAVVVGPADKLAGLTAQEAVQLALLHGVVVNVIEQCVEDCYQIFPRPQIDLLH